MRSVSSRGIERPEMVRGKGRRRKSPGVGRGSVEVLKLIFGYDRVRLDVRVGNDRIRGTELD